MSAKERAWTWETPGDSLSLRLAPQAVPEPRSGELIVANRVIALNPVDWKVVESGIESWQPGHIPGVDGAGIVLKVGPGVLNKVGDRIAYHQDLTRNGSFASYTCISAAAALPIPSALSDEVAASVPCPGLTAWQALDKVPLQSNRDVLITGGGGSAGLFLVQLALRRGFRVWTTASAKHRSRLLSLGVGHVFDYRSADWRAELQEKLGARKLFAAFDTVSGDHAQSLTPLVGYNGHIVCIQDRLSAPVVPPFSKAISQHEVALNAIFSHGTDRDWQIHREAAARIMEQLVDASLQPPSIIRFDFEELPSAMTPLKDGQHSGKFVTVLPS